MTQPIHIESFFEPETFTLSHVVQRTDTKDAVVIDPVLDFDSLEFQTSTKSVDGITKYIHDQGLKLHYVLETHAHADHLSACQLLKARFGAQVVIGAKIVEVQRTFRDIFGFPETFPVDGSQFDRLVRDGEKFSAGKLEISVLSTPGHTPACVTYRIDDALFVGDAVFAEDYGTGRCDFPGGDADQLYDSVHERIYGFPDDVRVYMGHDYQPGGRPLVTHTTVGALRRSNIQLSLTTLREDFVRFRMARDATLTQPKLLFPAVQVNIAAGTLPSRRGNGHRYLQIPINLRVDTDEAGKPV